MGIYSLTLLFIGVTIIGLSFARTKVTKLKNIILYAVIFVTYLVIFFVIHHQIEGTCKIILSDSLDQLSDIISSWGIAAPLMSILLMVLQSVIAPLPAMLITAANGLLFGVFWGTVISWIGAMCGALVSYGIARWFFDNYARKLLSAKRIMEYVERISARHGFMIVLIARLFPHVSFDTISYAAGLSTIRTRHFVLATGIGMLPATIVYTVFGHEISKLKQYSTVLLIFSSIIIIVLITLWILGSLFLKKKPKTIFSRRK